MLQRRAYRFISTAPGHWQQGPRHWSHRLCSGATTPSQLGSPKHMLVRHSFHISTDRSARDYSNQSSRVTKAPRITISIDGEDHEYSAVLLRNMCTCTSCVHESTKQRLYSTAEIPSQIRAKSVEAQASEPRSIKITWENDARGFDHSHETCLSLNDLRGIKSSGASPGPFQESLQPHVLWGSENYNVPDTTFQEYMQNDVALYRVVKQLRTHGLVFITDIPGVEDAIVKIGTRIGPMKDTFYGYTWDVRTVPSAINAAYTSDDLGFHTDLLYFQNPPHIQLLHCKESSSSGGASVFTDAFKSAVDLFSVDEDAFNTLASIPVNYHYNHPDSNLYHTTKTVFELWPLKIGPNTYPTVREYLNAWKQRQRETLTLPNLTLADCLEKINWGPPFQAPFSLHEHSGQPSHGTLEALNRKVEGCHAAARKLSSFLHRPRALHERLMKPGECVLFDNTRVLHGRRGFDAGDVGKARWLEGGYVDKDPYLSKLRVLRGKFEGKSAQI